MHFIRTILSFIIEEAEYRKQEFFMKTSYTYFRKCAFLDLDIEQLWTFVSCSWFLYVQTCDEHDKVDLFPGCRFTITHRPSIRANAYIFAHNFEKPSLKKSFTIEPCDEFSYCIVDTLHYFRYN